MSKHKPANVVDFCARSGAAYRLRASAFRRHHAPSIKKLPFVVAHDERLTMPAMNYWNDEPSGIPAHDWKRGKDFARLTIEAMIADGCSAHYLERIFEAIVTDAVRRRRKGGKGSRRRSMVVDGFLFELSRMFCERVTGNSPGVA